MKKISKLFLLSAMMMLSLSIVSCDNNVIYENQPECATVVKFIYTKHRQALHSVNLIGHDAFSTSVEKVHLFIYDNNTGKLVMDKTEDASNLLSGLDLGLNGDSEKSYMKVNLAPGSYRLVAWCGLDESDQNNAFYLSNTKAGYSECNVKLKDNNQPVNLEKYEHLYHGSVASAQVPTAPHSTVVIPVELTKNTNDISVWVQHTTSTFDDGDYTVVYTDANGTMNFDNNALTNDNILEYHPHTTSTLTSDSEYNGSIVKSGALIAHISTARLMAHRSEDAKLEVRDKEGKVIYSLPFIKYLTQMQTFTSDHQYYLDCEDTYNCTFYLTGDAGNWLPMQIIINNWTLVPNQSGGLEGDDN